jgi:hypothetical protein
LPNVSICHEHKNNFSLQESADDDSSFNWNLGENVDDDDIPEHVNIEAELEQFRNQWQSELQSKQQECIPSNKNIGQNDRNENQMVEPTIEEQVKLIRPHTNVTFSVLEQNSDFCKKNFWKIIHVV